MTGATLIFIQRKNILKTLLISALAISALCATRAHAQIQKSEEKITREDLLAAVRAGRPQHVDTRAAIVGLLKDVKDKKISPEEFYQKVSELNMPPGMELRHALMEVKKDVGNYLGEEGLKNVFGEVFDSGATRVEAEILTHRKKIVFDTIKLAIVEYKKQVLAQTGELPKFTFYYGEVGGWPNESFEELKFAGDIDFNFLAGNLDAAMALKKIFDDLIKKRYKGRTPEEIDIPCTVHGMATSEVYVGKHGQSFAEEVTKVAWEIDFENAGMQMDLKGKEVPFGEVLNTMVSEAKMHEVSNSINDLQTLKWPYQPGISLEMIRHFEHDIAGKDVFTDLESFVKAAKYTDRGYTFLEKELGDQAKVDPALKKLVADLTTHKKNPKKQVDLIKDYFKAIGKEFPFEANLEINENGKGRATIDANKRVIEDFWDICRKSLWDGANQVLRKKTYDLKARINALGKDDIEESKAIYEELVKLDEMLEIEDRVLNDKTAGVHDIDPEYKKLIAEFREARGTYKQKSAKFGHIEYVDPKLGKTYAWVEKMLKMGEPDNIKWAAAAMLSAPGKFNDYLDFLDDGLMTNLRNGRGQEYIEILRKGQGYYWDEQANQFFKGTRFEGRFDNQFQAMEKLYNEKLGDIQKDLDKAFENKLSKRGLQAVHKINNTFNESVNSSAVGRTMMTGMMLISLKDELPIYYEKIANEDYSGLAAEFFKRRVPFGGAVEKTVMGDYYGAAWEYTTTIIPPLGIAAAAKGVGESIALGAIDAYIDEELERFIDKLYEDAEFKVVAVEKVGEDIKISQWQLMNVSYEGKTFDYQELIAQETADAREMADCLQKPTAQRPACFPVDKMSNGVFEWWRNRDAFEQAFRKTDPWIQVILEMKAHPNVGPKLEEHFRYQLYTRFEQVKVQFLKKLKEQLEDRRAGEQALLSGKFTQMYDELIKIAEDLDVRVQLEANIEEEFGGQMVQFLTWMKDYVRGAARALQGDVDVWDVYEQLSSFVARNLRTYNKILEMRTEALDQIPLNKEDQGLKILTGPYFFDGKEDTDESTAKKWSRYPSDARDTMTDILSEIKSSSDVEEKELNLEEGAYDQDILDRLMYHDTFREMWKHLNSRMTSVDVDSYLGKANAKQTQPNAEGVMSDQDRALQRFKLHSGRVNELIEEFKQHYQAQKQQEDEQARAEGDVTVLFSDMEGLLARLIALKEETITFNNQYVELVSDYEEESKDIIKRANKLYTKVAQEAHRRKNTDQMSAQTIFQEMKSLSEQLALLRDKLQGFTLAVCEYYEDIKGAGNIKTVDSIFADAQSQHTEAKSTFREATKIISEMKTLRGKLDNIERLTPEDLKAQDIMAEAQNMIEEIDSFLAQGDTLKEEINKGKRFEAQANVIFEEANNIVTESGKMLYQNPSKDNRRADKEVSEMFKDVRGAHANVLKETGQTGSLVISVGNTKFKVESIRTGLDVNIKALTKMIGTADNDQNEYFKNEALAMYDAGMLFVDSINENGTNADICMTGIRDQHGKIATPDARVAEADCSKYPGTTAQWDAADKVVRCQCADGYVWAKNKGECISKRENDLARLDCSKFKNTKPVWNAAINQATCDCISGTSWNSTNTACEKPRSQQVAEANCSSYGPAEAYWNNNSNKVLCRCKAGYEWSTSGSRYCVKIAPKQPAYDPYDNYDRGGYNDGYNDSYDDTYQDNYGVDDFVNDLQGIADTLNKGQNRSSGSSSNRDCVNTGNSAYDNVINGAVNCNDSSSGSNARSGNDCANNYTMGSSGLYGGTTFKCNCPGWGFDPAYGKCRQGFSDRYSGKQRQPSNTQKRPSGITTNKSREQYQGSSGQGQGEFTDGGSATTYSGMGDVDCKNLGCRWQGGHYLFGVPSADMAVNVYCMCGCDQAPDYRCEEFMPKPQPTW